MKWITREKIMVNRVVCPWLIRHFVDHAEFVFFRTTPTGRRSTAARCSTSRIVSSVTTKLFFLKRGTEKSPDRFVGAVYRWVIFLGKLKRNIPQMKTSKTTACWLLMASISLIAIARSFAADLDTGRIDELTGLKGKMNEKEGVYKVTFPRDDVKVVVDGWTMPPFMGLGTWAAFTKGAHTEAMVMGDTVLFEDEVNPAMSAAFDNGLSVTALHNHFFFDHPKVYFMHIEGEGTVEQLAGAVRKVYDKIKEIRAANPQLKDSFDATPLPEKSSISAEPLNKLFGMSGEANNGMLKFSIGHPATMHGVKIDNAMGVNTWMAFAGSDDNAVVDGDFAVTEDQLQSALKAMRAGGINIVAIHSHMTHEQPRILFFHYWGKGPAKKLAEAIQGALLASGLSGVTTQASN